MPCRVDDWDVPRVTKRHGLAKLTAEDRKALGL